MTVGKGRRQLRRSPTDRCVCYCSTVPNIRLPSHAILVKRLPALAALTKELSDGGVLSADRVCGLAIAELQDLLGWAAGDITPDAFYEICQRTNGPRWQTIARMLGATVLFDELTQAKQSCSVPYEVIEIVVLVALAVAFALMFPTCDVTATSPTFDGLTLSTLTVGNITATGTLVSTGGGQIVYKIEPTSITIDILQPPPPAPAPIGTTSDVQLTNGQLVIGWRGPTPDFEDFKPTNGQILFSARGDLPTVATLTGTSCGPHSTTVDTNGQIVLTTPTPIPVMQDRGTPPGLIPGIYGGSPPSCLPIMEVNAYGQVISMKCADTPAPPSCVPIVEYNAYGQFISMKKCADTPLVDL